MGRTEGKGAELSDAKRRQILAGARAIFGDLGFEASVDAVAAKAGVSKATIYNHFHDKQALFLAAFAEETQELREGFLSLLEMPSEDVESDVRRIAERLIRLVGAPANVYRSRVVAGSVARFPELGRSLYECGMQTGHEKLAQFFARAGERGLLRIDDAEEAAVNFAALCKGQLSRQLQLGVVESLTEELVAKNAERAVRMFLRAYGH